MGNNDYPVIEADVLIVGVGSAGTMAAIRAKEVHPDQNKDYAFIW
jgi:succinate dehydrogenase/fumarate reductase flavoprotein subunit